MIEINDGVVIEIIEKFIKLPILIYQKENFVYANEEAVRFLGYSKEELIKMKFWDIVHPEDREIVKKRGFERLKGKKIVSEYRFKILTKSGKTKWIYFKALKIKFKGELSVIVSGVDITKEIVQENSIKESKEKYKNLFIKYQEILKLILEIDFSPDSDIESFLSQLLNTGFTLIEEAKAGSCFLYKDNKVKFIDSIGHDINILKKLYIPMSAFEKVEWGVQILKNINNETVKGLKTENDKQLFLKSIKHAYESLTFDLYLKNIKYCGLTFDITEKGKHFSEESKKIITVFYKLANALLSIKHATNELKNEKSHLETVFESIGEGIIVTDNDLKIKNMNYQANKITGFKLQEIYGKDISLVFTLFDFDTIEPIKFTKDNITNIVTDEKKKALLLDKFSKEKPILYKVNQIISKSETFKREDKKNIFGYIFIFEDISKILNLEEQLRKSQINETIAKLAGGIAHDFNNILGGILGAAEIIKEKVKDNNELKDFVNLIITSSNVAKETTKKLLTLTKKTPHSFKIYDIHEIIKNSLKIAKQTLSKKIEIKFIPEAKKVKVLCFEPDLQNALLNLYINADDAMPDGGTLTIKTENLYFYKNILNFNKDYRKYQKYSLSNNTYVKISIKDTGIGIEKEMLDKIFTPYFTTKETGKGTGLGLASVLNIVESLKGIITVDSEPNKGTKFEILLPVILTNEKTSSKIEKSKSNVNSIVKNMKNGYALIIDDEEIIRKTTSKMLQMIGFKTIECNNGLQGINDIKKNLDKIKVVFLDLVMPKLGGKETLREIRKINKETPVIIMSGYIKNENIDELLSIDNTFFLPKPFSKEELIEIINKVFY